MSRAATPNCRLLLRRPEVLEALGVSNATLQRLVARGELVKPRRLSREGRAVAWRRLDIEAYVNALPESDVMPVKASRA